MKPTVNFSVIFSLVFSNLFFSFMASAADLVINQSDPSFRYGWCRGAGIYGVATPTSNGFLNNQFGQSAITFSPGEVRVTVQQDDGGRGHCGGPTYFPGKKGKYKLRLKVSAATDKAYLCLWHVKSNFDYARTIANADAISGVNGTYEKDIEFLDDSEGLIIGIRTDNYHTGDYFAFTEMSAKIVGLKYKVSTSLRSK